MRIENDIVYASDPTPILKVRAIKPLKDYKLHLEFNNNEVRVFDFSPLIQKSLYQPLKNKAVFNAVVLEHGVPVWANGDIDISPEYLYNNSIVS